MKGTQPISRSRSLPKLVDKHDLGVEEGKTRSVFVVRSAHSPAYGYVRKMSLVSVLFYVVVTADFRFLLCDRTIILTVVLFGHENWAVVLREEDRESENMVLRKVSGLERGTVTGERRRVYEEELNDCLPQ